MAKNSSSRMGMNRTGKDMAPALSKEMLEGARLFPADSREKADKSNRIRADYYQRSGSIGSIPIPGTLKGMAKAGLKKLTGKNAEIFIDKLGERLGFERTGTRLYEALIAKCETLGFGEVEFSIDVLKRFHDEELKHFGLLRDAMIQLGADPTAVTPSADVAGMASEGLLQVMTDPRTSVAHCIQAILVAELADNDGWNGLIQLAEDMKMDEMAEKFRQALDEENVHLSTIRKLYEQLVRTEAKMAA